MICRSVTAGGELVLEGNVRMPEGERFVAADLGGVEHVVEVVEQKIADYRWYWCYWHLCKVVDAEYEYEEDEAPPSSVAQGPGVFSHEPEGKTK